VALIVSQLAGSWRRLGGYDLAGSVSSLSGGEDRATHGPWSRCRFRAMIRARIETRTRS